MPTTERRCHYTGPQSVARHLSQRWGVSEGHANQLLHGHGRLIDRVVDVIRAYRASHREPELFAKLRPIFAAFDQRRIVPSLDAALDAYAEVDLHEDLVRLRWLRSQSAADLDELLRVTDRVIVRAMAFRDAAHQEQLRRHR
jgi:hypothetical protein